MNKNERLMFLSLTKQFVRVANVVANITESIPSEELRKSCESELMTAMESVQGIVAVMQKEWGSDEKN